jgi:hypothetical protein
LSDSSSRSRSSGSESDNSDSRSRDGDDDLYISDESSLDSEIDERYDPEENRLRIAEISGEQEGAPMEREALLRTDPDDVYLSRLVVRARARGGAGSGPSGEEEGRNRAQQNALPFPDRPLVPPQLPESENPEVDLPDGDERRCVMCLSREVKAMCVPCGHTAVCTFCAQGFMPMIRQDSEHGGNAVLEHEVRAKCPMCRARIRQMIRPYGAAVGGGGSHHKRKDKDKGSRK